MLFSSDRTFDSAYGSAQCDVYVQARVFEKVSPVLRHGVGFVNVLVIGVGGLGCPASLALAAAGVEQITLIDPDIVEVSNLHRQPWHTDADLGRAKVDSAAEKISTRFPATKVVARQHAVDASNLDDLLLQHDVAIDGTDRGETKLMLSDGSVRTKVPLIYGGVLRLEGLALRIDPTGPCLRCLFEDIEGPTCAQVGVLGPIAGWVGATQAKLALTGRSGVMHRFDGTTLTHREVSLRRAADCPVCG